MKNEVLFEDKNVRLEFAEKGKYLHETWWGITPGDVFIKLLDIIINLLNKKNCDGILLDAREHKGLGPESQDLAAKRIGEYAKKHGSIKQAIIVPADVFSKFSVDNYTKKLGSSNPVETRYFDNVEKAQFWLEGGL